jgi:hypothetical protein
MNEMRFYCGPKVLAKNRSIQLALDSGIEWLAIRKEVAEALPSLPEFLSIAGNVGHGTENKQTKLQALLQAHQKGIANFKRSGEYQWELVARAIEAQSPHLKGEILDMTTFVHKFAGGDNMPLLKDLDRWAKTQRSLVDVSGLTFKQLGQLDMTRAPHAILSLVKAAFASPDNYQRNGVSNLLTNMDIQNFVGKHRHSAIALHAMSAVADEFFKRQVKPLGTKMTDADHAKIMGDMQIRAAMLIMGKKPKGKRHFSNMDEIKIEYIDEVRAKDPENATLRTLESPFGDIKTPVKVPKAKGKASAMVKYDSNGNVTEASLKDMGFTVGAECELKRPKEDAPNTKCVIKRISHGIVTLGPADDDGDSAAPSGAQRVRQMSKTDDAFGIQLSTGALIDEYKVAPSNPLPTFLVFKGVATRNRNIPI